MPDVRLEAKLIWDREEVLKRARRAAEMMGLSISQQRSDGFVAGNQWWWAYELEIWVRWGFGTTMMVDGRTLKVGYNDHLLRQAALFIDLVRHPRNSLGTPGLANTKTWVRTDRDPLELAATWREPRQPRKPLGRHLPMQVERGRTAVASLRKQMPVLGVAVNERINEALSDITSEALSRAPETLPFFVVTPKDVEDWLGWLRKQWRVIPGMVDSLDRAMNQNRHRNARWFQENGYGGH